MLLSILRGGALALAASPAVADVLCVDPGDPAAYQIVQGAVDAAAEGDVILIANGYALLAFTIDGKSLTVVVDGPLNDMGIGEIVVRNLGAGQRVTMRGLKGGSLALENNVGEVWVDTARFAPTGSWPFPTQNSLEVTDCDAVVLAHCLVAPRHDRITTEPLLVVDSEVAAFDCQFFGASAGEWGGSNGANGATLVNSELHAEACLIRGCDGQGGYYCGFSCGGSPNCGTGGNGGDGVGLDATSTFRSRASLVVEGEGGAQCSGGADGMPISNGGGTVVDLFGIARYVTTDPTVREGATLPNFLQGRAGDLAFLLVSENTTHFQLSSPYVGELFLGAGFQIVPAGVLDGLGTGFFGYAAPTLPVGEDARTLTFQPVFIQPVTGWATLGGPTRAVVLRAGL